MLTALPTHTCCVCGVIRPQHLAWYHHLRIAVGAKPSDPLPNGFVCPPCWPEYRVKHHIEAMPC